MTYDDIKRIGRGGRRQIHDDITVIVVYLDDPLGSSNGRLAHSLVDYTCSPVDIFSLNEDEAQDQLQMLFSERNASRWHPYLVNRKGYTQHLRVQDGALK